MMEIKQVFLKTRAEFGKQCIFDIYGPHVDENIAPDPSAMDKYILKTHCNVGVQNTKQFALHESQTVAVQTKNSGMFHFEGGWPKEINPRDEETTARFRRRIEKDEAWAPKLRDLFQQMEHNILQNGALNIYEHYFDDMIPTELVKPRGLRTVNVYEDPQTPMRPVNDISWSPDSGSKMVVSYCFLELGTAPDYSNIVYIWQIDDPTKPWMTLRASSATVVSEFNPRDPSVLAGGLTSGQVCSWDIRTGDAPVQTSHRQFSHRDHVTAVKWITTKSNTEFFSGSADGRAMWWDMRKLRGPTEVLVFDLQAPNESRIDRAIGVSSACFDSSISTKFMFGLENGVVISGTRKARTPAEKLALRFNAHYGPVACVDRNGSNPKVFLTVGDCTARVWAEDTREDSLLSTKFITERPVGGCWNKARHSTFYVTTCSGMLIVWDLLADLRNPILTTQLCKQKLTAIAAHETGALLAVGNSAGNVYLVESTEALYSFDKNDRNDLASYLERCSRFAKAVDTRLKEIKLTRTYVVEEMPEPVLRLPSGKKKNKLTKQADKRKRQEKEEKLKEHRARIVHRRRPRDESPELQKAEERFFEIVEKEKQKYEDDEDLALSLKAVPSVKRIVSRKIEKVSVLTIDETKGIRARTPRKSTVSPRKTKITISTMETQAQDVEQAEVMTEESSPPLPETIVESPAEEISKRKRRKMARRPRKRRAPVVLRLPRPCKIGVCKPDICCRRRTALGKLRFADRAAGDRAKWIRDRVAEGTGSKRIEEEEEDVDARTSVDGEDRARRKKRDSWTRLQRAGERDGSEGIRLLRETTAPLEELTKDARRAKREIREAVRSGGARARARALAGKTRERRRMLAEKSRRISTDGAKDEGRVPVREVSATRRDRILAARRSRRPRRVATDPCAPFWEPPALARELRTLLGDDPAPASIEKAGPGMAYFEEIEAARGRIYPRISEFHSIE